MTQMKHLSIVDGAFLHMETAEMPMHVGSLNLFEPPAGYRGEGVYETLKAIARLILTELKRGT